MKKFILIFILILPLFGMVWDDEAKDEQKIIENLLFDISEFIVNHKSELTKLGYELDDICWTSMNRLGPQYDVGYPLYMKAGITYIVYTYTTGENVRVCWLKDNNNSHSEIRTGNKIIYYYTPKYSGSYHYMVKGVGNDYGMHISYIIQIIKKGEV